MKYSTKRTVSIVWHTRLIPLGVLVACVFAANTNTAAERPNILWIVGENFSLDLGCYGQANVHTPNLDALSVEGVKYTNCWATSPVCAPSRSAFLTGMYQTTTDTHNMRSHRTDDFHLPPGVRPLTHRLQQAGYFTTNIKHIDGEEVGTGKLDLNFVNEGPIYQSDDWTQLKDHQPFFAQINLPEAEYDIYDRRSGKKERVEWVGERIHRQIATEENVQPPPYYPDHKIVRQEWARYLNSVSGADLRVGRILRQLKEDGLEDNTIVVFFADNGRLEARGIHWCWASGLHVPLLIRWPNSMRTPSTPAPGSTDARIISLIDLTATTLALCGVDQPPLMQGRSFIGANTKSIREYAFSARDRIDETVISLRSVNDGRYHYIRNFTPGTGLSTLNRYKEKCFLVQPLMRQLLEKGQLHGPAAELLQPIPSELLYDLQSDPHEIRNLLAGNDSSVQLIVNRMRAALAVWMTETGDRGEVLEPATFVAQFENEMHDWFGTPSWYRPSRTPR